MRPIRRRRPRHSARAGGDSGVDVEAARAAGVPVVLVPDGYTGVPTESLDADCVLEDLSSLPLEIRNLRVFQFVGLDGVNNKSKPPRL